MKFNYVEGTVNVFDMYRATVVGRSKAGVYVQLDGTQELAFVPHYHSLRNGSRVLCSVKYPPKEDRCMQLIIDSILSYAA